VVIGLLLAALAAGSVLFASSAESEPAVLSLGVVLSALSLVIAGIDGTLLMMSGAYRSSSLSLFPSAGVVVVSLAIGAAALTPGEVISAWLIGQAPLLCGASLVLRGLALRSSARVAASAPLFFPDSPDPLRLVEGGQTLSLSEGLVVPADARIESGSCSVMERCLSPIPAFRIRDEGEIVLAGSLVLAGSAEAVSLSGTKDSVLQRVESLVTPYVEETERTTMAEQDTWVRSFAVFIAFVAVAVAISWDKRSGFATDVLLAGGLTLFVGATGYLIDIVKSAGCSLVRAWARAGFVSTRPSTLSDLNTISKIVVDSSCIDLSSVCEVRELETLDDRVGREALCSCVASLLGRADDMALVAAGDYCRRLLGRVVPERVLDLREYEGRGVCGSVKGVEISIGSEDFIVERGIMLQPSDIVTTSPEERVLLVAIDNDVIARFWIRYGQGDLVSQSVVSPWPADIKVLPSTGAQGEITAGTLLIKGRESAVLGRSHSLEVARFDGERFEFPKATLVALTARLHHLPVLLRELHAFNRRASHLRLIIAGATLVCLVAVLGGLLSAIVPIIVLGSVAVFLSL
jgi:hypothetical protein